MKANTTISIPNLKTASGSPVKVFYATGKIITNLFGDKYEDAPADKYLALEGLSALNGEDRYNAAVAICNYHAIAKPAQKEQIITPSEAMDILKKRSEEKNKEVSETLISLAQKFIDFFSEFRFTVSARYLNTLARFKSAEEMQEYTVGYARLMDTEDSQSICEKVASAEFGLMCNSLLSENVEKQINKRFVVYYGDAGTGKTTKAIEENPSASVVTCNASILPDELLRTFDFNDENGNPVFKKSALRIAMEEGQTIVFDEINLLNFDCLRMLQTLLDGKEKINYNNETIQIKDGFKIIGTMNLIVNDQVYSLPQPLVDRAETIKCFTLSAKDLAAFMS